MTSTKGDYRALLTVLFKDVTETEAMALLGEGAKIELCDDGARRLHIGTIEVSMLELAS